MQVGPSVIAASAPSALRPLGTRDEIGSWMRAAQRSTTAHDARDGTAPRVFRHVALTCKWWWDTLCDPSIGRNFRRVGAVWTDPSQRDAAGKHAQSDLLTSREAFSAHSAKAGQ